MFLKLLKQDFRATARLMLPVYVAAVLLAILSRLGPALQSGRVDGGFLYIFTQLMSILFVLAMFAVVIVSFVLMIWRFKRNLMSDEGYLMFTLPVSTGELIWSKLIVAIAWFFCSAVVVSLCALLVSYKNDMLDIFTSFNLSGFSDAQQRSMLLGVICSVLVTGVNLCLMFYAAMAVGQSFRSHKTLMTVVFFFVFYIVVQLLSSVVLSGTLTSVAGSLESMLENDAVYSVANALLWRTTAFNAVVAAVYYAITHFMLSKRLNLQ